MRLRRLLMLALLFLTLGAAGIGCLQPSNDVERPSNFVTVERELLPNELSRDDAAAGWIKLFDGESLFGWTQEGEAWRVEDGALVCDGNQPALLSTTSRFANYELRWEAWVDQSTIGSILVRQAGSADEAGSGEIPLGADAIAAEPAAAVPAASGDAGKWTAGSARIVGSRVTMTSATADDSTEGAADDASAAAASGRISLVSSQGAIKFRNVYLRPVGMQPLFNRQDLTGWRNVAGRPGEFEAIARAKEFRVYTHQPGAYLETEETYDDFVLQADVIFNGRGYNAGILFRALDGTAEAPAQGYELELDNAVLPDDRTQPKEFGTGGIQGLVPVRRQVASDLAWFVLTLVADGPHVAVWVDGEQVTDWTDSRPPQANPRDGLRTEAGRIGLEAGGPEIDLFLQDLEIARLSAIEN